MEEQMIRKTEAVFPLKEGIGLELGEKDPGFWQIIEIDQDQHKALVVSEHLRGSHEIHPDKEPVQWEDTALEKWLNEEFLTNTFSDEELRVIVPDQAGERVFLLSEQEVKAFFGNDWGRRAGADWWLRDQVRHGMFLYVSSNGTIPAGGSNPNYLKGIRPALWVDLSAEMFSSRISVNEKGEQLIRQAEYVISGDVLLRANPGIESAKIPEGIREIAPNCFSYHSWLEEVVFPESMRFIKRKAFEGCCNLEELKGDLSRLSWENGSLDGCIVLVLPPAFFCTEGRLGDVFTKELEHCTPVEAACLYMAQSEPVWREKLSEKLTRENIPVILAEMMERLKKSDDVSIAERVTMFAIRNCPFLPEEMTGSLCALLERKGMTALSEKVKNSTVKHFVVKFEDEEEKTVFTDELIHTEDGTLVMGTPVKTGNSFLMSFGVQWKILDVDLKEKKALCFAVTPLKDCSSWHYDMRLSGRTTWETSDIRQQLSEYFDQRFTDEEKEVVLLSRIDTPDHPADGTGEEDVCEDHLFLLSLEEAEKYFKNDQERKMDGIYWLRSLGEDGTNAAVVDYVGSVHPQGVHVSRNMQVHPAFWLDLEKAAMTWKGETCLTLSSRLKIKDGVLKLLSGRAEKIVLPPFVDTVGENAVGYQKGLKILDYTADDLDLSFNGIYECPNLKLPAKYYKKRTLIPTMSSGFVPEDAEVYAYILLYQAETGSEEEEEEPLGRSERHSQNIGAYWMTRFEDWFDRDNVSEILKYVIRMIHAGMVNPEEAARVTSFVKHNVPLLKTETLRELIEAMEDQGLKEAAEELLKEKAVREKLGLCEAGPYRTIALKDGTVLAGSDERKELQPGDCLCFGGSIWRIIEIDSETQSAFAISEENVDRRPYQEDGRLVPIRDCDLRRWLTGEYYETAFSEKEKSLLLPEEKYDGDYVFLPNQEQVDQYSQLNGLASEFFFWIYPNESDPSDVFESVYPFVADERDGAYEYADCRPKDSFMVKPVVRISLKAPYLRELLENREEVSFINETVLASRNGVLKYAGRGQKSIILPSYISTIPENCFYNYPDLESLVWEGDRPKMEGGCFGTCPKLLLPAEFYKTREQLKDDMAAFMPGDPEAIAYTLAVQENHLLWMHRAAEVMDPSMLKTVTEMMRELEPEKKIYYWQLAGAPYVYDWRSSREDFLEDDLSYGFLPALYPAFQEYPVCEKIAGMIDHSYMISQFRKQIPSDPLWYVPWAVYGNDDEVLELARIAEDKKKVREILSEVLTLNGCPNALRYLDQQGKLYSHTGLYGLDEDEVREKQLCAFDWSDPDLQTILHDLHPETFQIDVKLFGRFEVHKEPQPAEYEPGLLKKAEEVRWSMKGLYLAFFRYFLSGHERSGKTWKEAYLSDPFLRTAASRIVWTQNDGCFTVNENGETVSADEGVFTVNDDPVMVAHPMEMGKEETEAWKQYFNSHEILQPFDQLGELVLDPQMVTGNRYNILQDYFQHENLEIHGIFADGIIGMCPPMKDCTLKQKWPDVPEDEEDVSDPGEDESSIVFTYPVWNRQVNHIAGYLEWMTREPRILQDDTTVMILADYCTAEEINEMIRLAVDNHCVKCASELIEYLHEHMPDYDETEEFAFE